MSASLLQAVAVGGPVGAGLIALLATCWALWGIRSPEVRARIRPVQLLATAAFLLLVVASILDLLGGWFLAYGVFTDAVRPSLARAMASLAPPAVELGAIAALSSVVGHVAFARLGPPRRPASGSVLGPVALIALALSASLVSTAAANATSGAEQAAAANPSALLHVTVGEVVGTAASDGATISAVRLRVTVRADSDIDLAPSSKVGNPRFVLTCCAGLSFEPPTADVSEHRLAAGAENTFDLVFDTTQASLGPNEVRLASTSQGGAHTGPWVLRVDIEDQAGLLYTVSTGLTVTSTPAPSN